MDLHHKIINRVKILSGMDITLSRIPQRGYFKVVIEERKIELYTFCFPSVLGEKVVMQIHYRKAVSLSLDHLGMFPTMLGPFKKAVARSHGLILIVGPPGNGKTTTSYCVLGELDSPGKSIMSFEHVLKYEIEGMTQGRPDEVAEFHFADGVKAMMDQSPDVALVGEVNEEEVGKGVIHGAFAARVVIARMSGNDTISALNTLVDMGIQPFLVTACLNAALAQRLVRKLCDKCRRPFKPPPSVIEELGYRLPPETQFFEGAGCEACNGTGYRGFLGIFELFLPSEQVHQLMIARASQDQVREAALQAGMTPLKKDGIQKAIKGYTTIEEVMHAL
jgi:type II secretory ATPase GspE/PulE/Tfp pilus assembly ATPase PilB-like protein